MCGGADRRWQRRLFLTWGIWVSWRESFHLEEHLGLTGKENCCKELQTFSAMEKPKRLMKGAGSRRLLGFIPERETSQKAEMTRHTLPLWAFLMAMYMESGSPFHSFPSLHPQTQWPETHLSVNLIYSHYLIIVWIFFFFPIKFFNTSIKSVFSI